MRLCLGLFLLSLASCGYSFRRSEARLGDEVVNRDSVQRLFIPVVDNMTNRSGIEPIVTSALRETLSSIRGIELVSDVDRADYKLLVTINDYSTRHGAGVVRGDNASAQGGGIGNKQSVASEIFLNLRINARLFEKVKGDARLYRIAWTREFERSAVFEASKRFTDQTGSSSAPHINASREMIQVRMLAYGLGQSIVDQISQNF